MFVWAKKHKVWTGLIVLLVLWTLLVVRDSSRSRISYSPSQGSAGTYAVNGTEANVQADSSALSFSMPPSPGEMVGDFVQNITRGGSGSYGSNSRIEGGPRMVARSAQMSLVVKDVSAALEQIVARAQNAGGFMVSSSLSTPELAAYGQVSVRVPSNRLTVILEQYRKLGMKVTYETIEGQDITQEYVDVQARLAPMRQVYEQSQQLMKEAGTVEQKMAILNQLQSLQQQIDSLVGQEKYLKDTAGMSYINVSLSTDEYELPYAPSGSWRPSVVFKQAVRDLVLDLRELGNLLIWVMVYGVIWIPVATIILYVRAKRRQKTKEL